MDVSQKIQAEWERAAQARAKGNEGQARVCARRAAGLATREYFARQGRQIATASAYDLLQILREENALPDEMKNIAGHLTLRVTEEFKLPIRANLVAEAQTLCAWLLEDGAI